MPKKKNKHYRPQTHTDSEIVKALECCIKGKCITKNCPLEGTEDISSKCEAKLMELTLDLINRLQAENEKLQEMLRNLYTAVPIGSNKKFANELQKIKA